MSDSIEGHIPANYLAGLPPVENNAKSPPASFGRVTTIRASKEEIDRLIAEIKERKRHAPK